MEFGTFSMLAMEFSTVEMGNLERFVLILVYSYGGNRIMFGISIFTSEMNHILL
jgi:hypothetical protein